MQRLNEGWQFAKGEPTDFAPVSLPHDWLIYDPANLYKADIGWYRRALDTSFLKAEQRVFLRFDGVYMDSELSVNGQIVGEWKYGYTAFQHDITDFLRPDGHNELLMKVNFPSQSARWYTGAGIYRDVFLIIKNKTHFKADGIYITTEKESDGWHYAVTAEVETGGKPYTLGHTLQGAHDEIIAWDIDNPQLYTLHSELIVDNLVVDEMDTRFGFRTIDFIPNEGFFLNGRHIKLSGVCLHHDLGALGAAYHKDAAMRQLTRLRAMGVNAIRTAHNPPAKAFLELCDELGLLVVSEILDIWEKPKTPNDYARFFDAWVEKDVASWIRRDRNHPSVILWSVGNEIYDTHADAERGQAVLRRLLSLVKQHDPDGHAPATLCSNYMAWANTQKCAEKLRVVGYNYGESLYAAHHAAHPDWALFGAETCATVQSRAVYHFPLAKSILADDDQQCSSLGNSATSWGAKNLEICLNFDRDCPFSLGQFLWAGQDYLGEPTPYHTKNCYFGHLDTAGFPKDSYYMIQAAWTDYHTTPMVHLFPYWDFSPGQMIDVRVCSNAPHVELFLNGESIGAVLLDKRWIADFRLPYRPGTLRAVAYDARGAVIAEETRSTFGESDSLQLTRESFGILDFVTVIALDNAGNPVENANRRIRVQVSGGTLLALDNGDATDMEPYQADSRRLFGGKLLAVVKRCADGNTPRVQAIFDEMDIPIRKIELSATGNTFTAKVFPPNATHSDLHWRLTDAGGIDSPLGSLIVAEDCRSATVVPKGDGEAYVRCAARNGCSHISLFAQLEYTITGMGKPFLNPYDFVSGGLFNESNVELTNGNERGIATPRDGESHVGFRDLDFGPYGSDRLTLPLFPLSKDPFPFEIWEGMPLSGGERLTAVSYDKGSIWNTYIPVEINLPRRLRGVTTLCFVFRQKVHIKGFQFIRLEKAFQRLAAAECDAIYGDTYTKKAGTIERIGNNVTLVYEGMDFGSMGADHVSLRWRSALAKNSIQIAFSADGQETRALVEVDGASEYQDAIFPLGQRVTGAKNVSLIFLPGTDMDLAWIQFMG